MPTSTFFNLPPPKRERLLRAAEEEFSRKPFNEVSINRIVQAAEIPRGSFYQYFADKTDLFRYILSHFDQRLEDGVMLRILDACGGDLLAMPLVLFDLILDVIRENRSEFQMFLSILRQNMGMDVGQLWDFMSIAQTVLDRADMSHLDVAGREEQIALLDMLLSSTAQALMTISCGKLTLEESRKRLEVKIRIIRRGTELPVQYQNQVKTGDFLC